MRPANSSRATGWLAFTLDAVGVPVLFTGDLGTVPDQETGVTGELVRGLGKYLHDELVGDDFATGRQPFIEGVGLGLFAKATPSPESSTACGRRLRMSSAARSSHPKP